MKALASAPAKAVLTGEHFVVYGEPAIVMAIDLKVHVAVEYRSDNAISVSSNLGISGLFLKDKYKSRRDGTESRVILEPIKIAAQTVMNRLNEERGLNIEVNSKIPIASGLGSSGALAVATIAATSKLFGAEFTRNDVASLAFEAEKFVHITPSGIDQTVSTHGGIVFYRRGEKIDRLQVKVDIPIVIGNTGISRVTGDLVTAVGARMNKLPETMRPLIHSAGKLSVLAAKALKAGNLETLGELMDVNHGMLVAIGVSNEALDRLVYAARRGGALGAKLTGAGGGGCMIAISTPEKRNDVAKAVRKAGGNPIIANKTERGVNAWIRN